jgi:hypothetical protein
MFRLLLRPDSSAPAPAPTSRRREPSE